MLIEFNPDVVSLVIGLGNPGEEYTEIFHNVGQLMIAPLLNGLELKTPKKSFAYTKHGSYTIIIPRTYMNESGIAVSEALSYFKTSPESILVVHDDTDLLLGETRLQFGRGDAGHNGIKSIIASLGTEMFWRFRVGIRKEEKDIPRKKAKAFVLNSIQKEDKKILTETSKQLLKVLKIKNYP